GRETPAAGGGAAARPGAPPSRPRPRLYFLAVLADRGRDALRRGGTLFDARELRRKGALDELHAAYEAFEVEGPFPIAVVRTLLRLPVPAARPAFRAVADQVEASYEARGTPLGRALEPLHAASLALPPLAPAAAAHLDEIVGRFADYWVRSQWYTSYESFIAYVHELLARIALLRFVATSLPDEPLDALA